MPLEDPKLMTRRPPRSTRSVNLATDTANPDEVMGRCKELAVQVFEANEAKNKHTRVEKKAKEELDKLMRMHKIDEVLSVTSNEIEITAKIVKGTKKVVNMATLFGLVAASKLQTFCTASLDAIKTNCGEDVYAKVVTPHDTEPTLSVKKV